MADFKSFNRDKLDIFRWPEFEEVFRPLAKFCLFDGDVSRVAKAELFTVMSLASGCRNCQAHAGYSLHLAGVSDERIKALWDYERSSLFNEAERVLLGFGLAAGTSPNQVTADHFAELRKHFSDRQIGEIMAVAGISGFLNRYCDTLAYVTDQESIDWARQTLSGVGWEIGKHTGSKEEQAEEFPEMARGDTD